MLPKRISKEARLMVDTMYNYLQEYGQWMGTRTLRSKLGEELVDRVTKKYEPALFKRHETDQPDHYELTIYGFLNCDKAINDIDKRNKETRFQSAIRFNKIALGFWILVITQSWPLAYIFDTFILPCNNLSIYLLKIWRQPDQF